MATKGRFYCVLINGILWALCCSHSTNHAHWELTSPWTGFSPCTQPCFLSWLLLSSVMVFDCSLRYLYCSVSTNCFQSLRHSHHVPSLAVFPTVWRQRTQNIAVSGSPCRPLFRVSCRGRYVRSSTSDTSAVHVFPVMFSQNLIYTLGHNLDLVSSAYGVDIVGRAKLLNGLRMGSMSDFENLDFVPVWTDMLQAACVFSLSSFSGAFILNSP